MLADVIEFVACPACTQQMSLTDGSLRCTNGHTFDVAHHGYANLSRGDGSPGLGDTAAMVAARENFLGTGHYAPMVREVVARSGPAHDDKPSCIVDVGAGTGFYLAAVLDRHPRCVGLALDVSKYAARRAARAHPRMGAVVCDVWRRLPVQTEGAGLVLNVFSPRNGEEFRRILRPHGRLVVVVPSERHLQELAGALDLVTVDGRKEERLHAELDRHFERATTSVCEFSMRLSHADIEALVAMGPSARHTDARTLGTRVRELFEPTTVTASVTVSSYRPR